LLPELKLNIPSRMINDKTSTHSVRETWEEQKVKLKQKFIILTDNDLFFKKGNKDWMLARLQIKLGKTKEELLKIIAAL